MKKRVLVFPCGSEIGLEIYRSLKNSIHFEVFGASSIEDHGCFVFENYINNIPFVEDKNFIEEINSIVDKYKIDFIFPAHDSVVLKLAQNQEKINAKIITSPPQTCEICRSKTKTYGKLQNIIKTPKILSVKEKIDFPVFIKPDVGQGSKGAHKINNEKELNFYLLKTNDIIISEYLPGKEYTIDCFTNKNGELLFAEGRERGRINNGISVNSKPIQNPKFQEIAQKINSELSFRGVWFFQLKEDFQGKMVLMEIAPRIAGTMGLYRGLGINFAQLSLFDAMDIDVEILNNKFEIELDRALYSKYKTDLDYDTVYIDFDDTIIVDNKVNPEMITLLYSLQNKNKKIILITKHKENIESTLEKFNIHKKLFNEIIHISKSENKVDYITGTKAIFIDDSFAERKKVTEIKAIPTFDTTSVNVIF